MKALVSRSVIVATTLLIGFIIFSAKPSVAETPSFQFQSQKPESKENVADVLGKVEAENDATSPRSPVTGSQPLAPPASFVATAYSLRGRRTNLLPFLFVIRAEAVVTGHRNVGDSDRVTVRNETSGTNRAGRCCSPVRILACVARTAGV